MPNSIFAIMLILKFSILHLATSSETNFTKTNSNMPGGVLSIPDVGGIEKFNPHEQTNISVRWRKWLRSFNLFVLAKGVTNANQKWGLLLHCAGKEVLDIYDTLSDIQDGDYQSTVDKLSEYFTPKQNKPYERHVFRQMRQNEGETINEYCTRLRVKAGDCGFDNTEEAIRDQIIDTVRSNSLRKKFLEKGDVLTLPMLCDIAKTYEMTVKQAATIEATQMQTESKKVVNLASSSLAGSTRKSDKRTTMSASRQSSSEHSQKRCFRCNRTGHMARDQNCPARNKTCTKCGLVGHFSVCCKTKFRKPDNLFNKGAGSSRGTANNRKVYTVNSEHIDIEHLNSSDSDSDFIFAICMILILTLIMFQ